MSIHISVNSKVADESRDRISSTTTYGNVDGKPEFTYSSHSKKLSNISNENNSTFLSSANNASQKSVLQQYSGSQGLAPTNRKYNVHNSKIPSEFDNPDTYDEQSPKNMEHKDKESEAFFVNSSLVGVIESEQNLTVKKQKSTDGSLFERIFPGSKKKCSVLETPEIHKIEIKQRTVPSQSQISSEVPSSSNFASKFKIFTERKNNDPRNAVKMNLNTMWNNVKYGWSLKRDVKLKADAPIWLLGQYYHAKLHEAQYFSFGLTKGMHTVQDIAKNEFRQDLLSKVWLTYRQNFPKIPGSDFVTDSGWGCMLRAGQMMMAQALICHFLSRAWRVSSVQTDTTKALHKMIIRWFGDSACFKSPFSVHNLVSLGKMYDRKVGDWYGPTHVAHVLRKALIQSKKIDYRLTDLCMYVASDGIVFKQDVIDLCTNISEESSSTNTSTLNIKLQDNNHDCNLEELCDVENSKCIHSFENVSNNFKKTRWKSDPFLPTSCVNCEYEGIQKTRHLSECEEATEHFFYDPDLPLYSECVSSNTLQSTNWKSLILFVSVRLGNDKINPFYIPCLKSLLAYEHCVGIIGGRPKHALYFVGWQGEKLIYLDPHSCQPFVDVQKDDFNEKSFHCPFARTLPFTEMDPSCAIGFYFKTRKEFEYFCEKFTEIASPVKKNLDYPLFALAEGRRTDVEEISSRYASQTILTSSYTFKSDNSRDDDEYILL